MASQNDNNSSNVVISVPHVTINVSPYGFHRYASEFLAAEKSYEQGQGWSPVPYYLVCRTLELALKAFLLARGVSKHDIRHDLGHDLVRTLERARSLDVAEFVDVGQDVEKQIDKANQYYKNKDFEYFQITRAAKGYPDLPDLEILRSFADALVANLREFCLSAA